MRFLVVLAVWSLVGAPASAQTLLEAARQVEQGSRALTLALGQRELSWGQEQALSDLERLTAAAARIVQALETGDPPLESVLAELALARNRVGATLDLTGLPEPELALGRSTLQVAGRLEIRIRELADRFWGLDPPLGAAFASEPLQGRSAPPVYENPGELLREARGVRFAAERLGSCRPYPRGLILFGGGGFYDSDVRELRRAAYDFESAVSRGYTHVQQTRRAYERLQRAFYRLYPSMGGINSFDLWELERALDRLGRFYG